jgi:phosphoglycolate phosphatase
MTAEPAAHSTALEQVLAETWPVLLDFDGPVTYLFINGRNRIVADQMRQALPPGFDIPIDLRDTPDPLVILRWTALHTPHELAEKVDQASTAGEVAAAQVSELTPGALDLLQACAEVGRPVVMVSNNAEAAIDTFLHRHQLRHLVQAVIARVPGQPELMKPHPSAVERALDILDRPAHQSVLVGDSVTDIQVSLTTGIRSIGFAKSAARGRELASAGADAITDSMAALANLIAGGVKPERV